MIGQTVSHYRILEKLGEGGMGVVYKAEDTKLKRTVALKFLPRGLEAQEPERARFLQEAQAASALNHPNVCTIYDIAEHEGDQFIVMEYVDGQTLSRKAVGPDHRSALKVNDAIAYAIQIGEALEEAHSKGIVHRDIKTDNIMVNAKNQVKVMDFGLAKLKGSLKLTKTSSTVGTLAYMAPEQIQGGEVDARSDIFSFGVVLYEMLTGRTPFRGEHEAAMVYSIVNEDPTPVEKYLPDIPSELVHVLNRALEKDPEDRYQFVHEMVIDLRRLKKQTSRVVRPSEGFEPQRASESLAVEAKRSLEAFSRKGWFRQSAISAGAVVVLVLLYFLVWPLIHSLLFRSERIPIAVISFENQTGDPQFDYLRTAIPNLLITSLEQSSALRVTTWERMRDLLKQMGKADAEVINADLGFELCRIDSVRALVTGSFVKMGDMFATDVKVLDVENKALLKSASSKGEGVGSILKVQIDEIGKQIATGFGLPEVKVVEEQKPITEVTTTSMQAYNYFLSGRQNFERMYYTDARRLFEKAIELDSTFAMAHAYLASIYSTLGERKSRRTAYENAMKYADRTTRRERLAIESSYAGAILGDRAKRYELLKQMEREFPKDKMVHYALAYFPEENRIAKLEQATLLDPTFEPAVIELAYAYARAGKYQQAIETLERYAKASPGNANPLDSIGEFYFWMGNLDESIRKFKEAIDIKPDWDAHSRIAYVFAVQEDYNEAFRWINKQLTELHSPSEQYEARLWQCFYEQWLGSESRSLRGVPTMRELAHRTSNFWWEGGAVAIQSIGLVREGQFKQRKAALKETNRLFNLAYPANVQYYDAAFRLFQAEIDLKEGRIEPARSALAEASSVLPKLSANLSTWLKFLIHQVQGQLLTVEGKYQEAIEHEKNPPPLPEQALSASQNMVWINMNFPRDRLAMIFVLRGDFDSAIAEYERITTFDPASKDRRLINPIDRYELAKLYEKRGIREKAIGQYEKFLALWKNADADRPELKDAKARLAKLKGRK